MTIKTFIHIILLLVAFLMVMPASAFTPCDAASHHDKTPLDADNDGEILVSGLEDYNGDSASNQGCCNTGCTDCGLSCCTGHFFLLTSTAHLGDLSGLDNLINSLDQSNFWVGLAPFYHPPQA